MMRLNDSDILNVGTKPFAIKEGKITYFVDDIATNTICLSLPNTLTFPGLINSHDHLDYNLLPQLETLNCSNYVEWANQLATRWQPEIDAIRRVPENLSTQWGLYKNLLNGITHVVNHNDTIDLEDPLITVFKKCYSMHSVMMQRRWKYTLNNPFTYQWPFVFHIGEGVDDWSSKDIDTLLKWNYLRKKLIGVHGVAMNESQAKKFKALVWCPASNYFMFHKTAAVNVLKHHTTMLFGTDSTLTAHWSIWNHLHEALASGLADKDELIDMLSSNAAKVWGLNNYGMKEGNDADVVVAKKKSKDSKQAFFELSAEDILLVFCKGELKLIDESLLPQLISHMPELEKFSSIQVNQSTKYVYGNLPALANEIKSYCPSVSFPFSY